MSDNASTPAAASPSDGPAGAAPAEEKTLDQLLAEAQARIDEQKDAWMRAQADVQAAHKFAIERFAESLLPVMDSLEAALGAAADAPPALRDGVEITAKQLKTALQKANIAEIAPAAGDRFDPHQHQAMAAVEAQNAAPNSIVSVVLKGYALHERVIRPALVTVAKALEN